MFSEFRTMTIKTDKENGHMSKSDVEPWVMASKHHVDELLCLIESNADILPYDIEERIGFARYSEAAPVKLRVAYKLLAEVIPSKEIGRELLAFSNLLDHFVMDLKNTTQKPKGTK